MLAEEDFRCQHCGGLYPIDRSQKPPHVCPHCGNAAHFLFAMETTLGELVAAVRASGQPCEIRLEPIQDGLVLFTTATGTMGTRRYALDRENLAHPVEEPDPEADSWLSVGTPSS